MNSNSYPQFVEHSFRRLSLLIHQQDQSKAQSSSTKSIEQKNNQQPISRTNRTFTRPPKRSTISRESLNPSMNYSYSNETTTELPVHTPCERTTYDFKFEKDRQNDVREKLNIPPPFQRKWLRQPRYVPQERPVFGQIKQLQDE